MSAITSGLRARSEQHTPRAKARHLGSTIRSRRTFTSNSTGGDA